MRTKYSIKNAITQFINNIVTFLLLLITQSIFIKSFGIEYNGLNGLIKNILTLLNLFELGIGNSITYILYQYVKKNDKETIKSIMYFYKKAYITISILIFMIGLFFLPFLQLVTNQATLDVNVYLVYLLFLIQTVSTYFISYKRNLLFAHQRKYVINIINLIFTVILNVLQILIIYLTKNYYLFIFVKIICTILENVVIHIKVNKEYSYIKEKNIKKLNPKIKNNIIKRVKALVIHRTSGSISNAMDNILVTLFFGLSVSGIFANYNYIITTIKTMFSSIVTSAEASIGNLLIDEDKKKNYETFKKVRFLNFWITVVTSICLLCLVEPFITLWIGKEFLLSRFVLIVLIINYFQLMMRMSYSVFKDSAGIWIEDRFLPIIQCSSNLILSILFIKLIGLVGVFIGTIVSNFVVWFYSYPKYVYQNLFHRTKIEYVKELVTHIVIFAFIMIVSYMINMYSNHIVVSFMISMIVPNFLLFMIYRNTYEFKYYIELLMKMIRKGVVHGKNQ